MKHTSRTSVILLALAFALATDAFASEKVLHTFTAGKDGYFPQSLIADSAGNLYGVTQRGGAHDYGLVFKLTPAASGPWKETIIYRFTGGEDGTGPISIALDAAGNLYGVASGGGKPTRGTPYCRSVGCGTIFRLSPNSTRWTFNLLHTFIGMKDGAFPQAITVDPSGNIFVTTYGVFLDYGTVFEMSPSASGLKGRSVYVFQGYAAGDGQNPQGPVIEDSAGNLYGTTAGGGANALGAVYKLSRGSSGQWTETLIHSFSGSDGIGPAGTLTFDASGNLLGTAGGGAGGNGVIFELTPGAGDVWTGNSLYTFTGASTGQYPAQGLTLDAAGNIYGATYEGGIVNGACAAGCGVVFQLTPGASGWTEKILYSFTGGDGGYEPWAGPIVDASGNLYGVTVFGGQTNSSCRTGCGVVYEIPGAAAPVKSK